MKLKDETANLHSIIRHLVVLNVLVVMAMIGSVGFNFKMWQGLSISVPPDLRAGALLKPGEKSPEEVFAFTASVFQSLQHWRHDGKEDYLSNIHKLQAFLTQSFINQALDELDRKTAEGELEGITRQLSLPAEYVFENRAVHVLNTNEWIVKLPLEVKEYVDGQLVKDIEVLYSFVVKRIRTNVAENAHQIALHQYYQAPIRTKDYLSEQVVKQPIGRLFDAL
jgi:integrating conjugative element protein (TIGR03746 family)